MTQTKSDGPVLVLELNELVPPILDKMMGEGRLPNFKALHDISDVYVTHTDDPTLEPWVQWPTFHTGAVEQVHGAKELDEGHLIKQDRIWDKLADKDIQTLVFGSMNADAHRESVFLIPDPWSAGVKASDPSFSVFHDFVSFHVTEHTNPAARPTKAQTAAFLGFLMKRGLSVDTVMKLVRQITSEKTGSMDKSWRRAMLLDNIMWDVFEHTFKKQQPGFATYFANSTAFLQHRYWRHMAPEDYQVKPSEDDMRAYGSAVEDSYIHMDALVGKARKLVGETGRLVFVTALSQEAKTSYEHIGGKFVYRPHSFEAVFEWLGGPKPVSFEPVMTHQAWASFNTEADAIEAEAALEQAQSNGKTVMEWRRTGDRVFFWCGLISKVDDNFTLTHGKTGSQKAFSDLFALVGQVNNSQHCRDGAFWMQRSDRTSLVHADKLPLEQAHDLLLGRVLESRTAKPMAIAAE